MLYLPAGQFSSPPGLRKRGPHGPGAAAHLRLRAVDAVSQNLPVPSYRRDARAVADASRQQIAGPARPGFPRNLPHPAPALRIRAVFLDLRVPVLSRRPPGSVFRGVETVHGALCGKSAGRIVDESTVDGSVLRG